MKEIISDCEMDEILFAKHLQSEFTVLLTRQDNDKDLCNHRKMGKLQY